MEEEEGANHVSSDSFEALQSALGQMQQEHERLIGTAAHLSHEQEVNTEHIKVRGGDSQLYVMQPMYMHGYQKSCCHGSRNDQVMRRSRQFTRGIKVWLHVQI